MRCNIAQQFFSAVPVLSHAKKGADTLKQTEIFKNLFYKNRQISHNYYKSVFNLSFRMAYSILEAETSAVSQKTD